MAEYIEREKLLRDINHYHLSDGKFQHWVEVQQAADVAPVVHCKNCTHYKIVDEFEGGKRYMCKVNRFSYINSDGDMHYCSYGERKEDKAE